MSLQEELTKFFGTENWYQHALSNVIYTDGVDYFAENGEAYWCLDYMAYQCTPKFLQENGNFIVFDLKVIDEQAKMIITDGNEHPIRTAEWEYTDLETGHYRFYAIYDGVRTTLLLPGEY